MAGVLRLEELNEFRKNNTGKKIGVTFSCWDLLHAGHNIFLADSKEKCDILCVGLQTDPTIDRPSKNKPIQSLAEREIQIRSCRYVDYYFIYDTEKSLYESLIDLQPNIRFLGDDYIDKKFTGDDLPIEISYHERSKHTYSSTNLRQKIYHEEHKKRTN
jgi:glycerol-3-phosphate cytidylyltransferase